MHLLGHVFYAHPQRACLSSLRANIHNRGQPAFSAQLPASYMSHELSQRNVLYMPLKVRLQALEVMQIQEIYI